MKDYNKTKVRVSNAKISKAIQEKMFKLGYGWGSAKEKTIQYSEMPHLYFDNGCIAYTTSSSEIFFEDSPNKLITIKDILKSKTPKMISPTHLVIWEEDRDPIKFFTNEKEAMKFIDTLMENSDVKKDSIYLIKTKSVKKVVVETKKTQKLEEYKI